MSFCKAKAIKTAVSAKKFGSPTAAKSLDFSGQIVHSDLTCSSVSVGHLRCLTQQQHVPCVVRVTILKYTNSRLETRVQPAKSHTQDTDIFVQHP